MSHFSARNAISPNYSLERGLGAPEVVVAGIDEAGRGAWAGPVVAAAVILDPERLPEGIQDSKILSTRARKRLFQLISETSVCAVGIIERDEIDRCNILQASLQAMSDAAERLSLVPRELLVDGNHAPRLAPRLATSTRAHCVIKGDKKSLSIAAASIFAKVTRDRIMARLGRLYPHYGWESNAGYGTAAHRRALQRFGASSQHRRSFAPIHNILSLNN